ncbi:MAG: hypothetical protein KC636_00965 [Myxococcales bacterium]|nr:hypothetical protein [Myxococcales bacterium]
MLFDWSAEAWRKHHSLTWETGATSQAAAWALEACGLDAELAIHALRPFTEAWLRRAVERGWTDVARYVSDKLRALDEAPISTPCPTPPENVHTWALERTRLALAPNPARLRVPRARWNGSMPMNSVITCRSTQGGPRPPRDFADAVALVANHYPLGEGWRELSGEDAYALLLQALAGNLVHGARRMPEPRARARSTGFFRRLSADARFFTNHHAHGSGILTPFTFSFGLAIVEGSRATIIAISGED